MSQVYVPSPGWKIEYQKPLFYNIWLVGDQKRSAGLLILVAVLVVIGTTHLSGSLVGGLLAFGALLPTIFHIFVPVHFEINSDGIVRRILGRRRFISWDDIRGYQVRSNGIMLLPHRERFLLEAFRGFYLPIPPSLATEVLYRFRLFVDKIDYD